MKLKFDVQNKFQPDPFIFEDNGKFYIYATSVEGVQAYSSDDIFGVWHYEGIVAKVDGAIEYWAPSVIKIDGVYYMYVSFQKGDEFEFMHVLSAKSPLGPFENPIKLYNQFSIDSHVVKTESGLFMWFAQNNVECERVGTRVFVDRLLNPTTPENKPREVIVPTFDEEISCERDGRPWHTVEGPFWFSDGEWQYLMFSAGAFGNDTYHVGYCAAKSNETDLTKVDFVKATNNGEFCPVLIKNDFEEGTGHHSVIKLNGEYYAIYHARDYVSQTADEYVEARTARICKLNVKDGKITAKMKKDEI
jgi:GH43 family beta-xylosidase